MECQSINSIRSAVLTVLLALTALAVPVAAEPQVSPGVGIPIQLAVIVGITLVIGGGLILLAPDYTSRTTRRVHDEPLKTFLYGFGVSFLLGILSGILTLTGIGILIVIPILLGVLVVGQIGYLAVGRAVSGSWGVALLVAVVAAAVTVVPIFGTLVGFVLSGFGIGAAYLDFRDGSPNQRGRARKTSVNRR